MGGPEGAGSHLRGRTTSSPRLEELGERITEQSGDQAAPYSARPLPGGLCKCHIPSLSLTLLIGKMGPRVTSLTRQVVLFFPSADIHRVQEPWPVGGAFLTCGPCLLSAHPEPSTTLPVHEFRPSSGPPGWVLGDEGSRTSAS